MHAYKHGREVGIWARERLGAGHRYLRGIWGGMWAVLFGSAMFFVPGVGPLLVAGPFVVWIVGVLEGAAVVAGISSRRALASIGIPNNSVVKYETEVKNGKILLIGHGTVADVERLKELLDGTEATTATVHA